MPPSRDKATNPRHSRGMCCNDSLHGMCQRNDLRTLRVQVAYQPALASCDQLPCN